MKYKQRTNLINNRIMNTYMMISKNLILLEVQKINRRNNKIDN